ncbi:hypothetical protein MTO96_014360 [Rhipicephalus appendiculatus]
MMASDDSNTSSSDDEASSHGSSSKFSNKPSRSAALTCPSPTELLQSTRLVVLCNTLAVGTFCLLAVALLIAAVNRQQAAAAAVEAATQPSTPPSEETVERRHATEKQMVPDPPVLPASTRFVCVYRERVGQAGLDVRSFPYAYCHHLAYCCLSVLPSQGDRAALETLSQLGTAMGGTPFSVSVIVGGSSVEDPYLLALLLDTDSVQRLVERLALASRHMDESGTESSSSLFSRVYLHWKRPRARYKAAITRLADVLRIQLKPHSLRLGLVVDGDSDVAAAFDFPSKNYGDRVCHALRVAAVAVNGSEAAIDISYGSTCNMNITNVYSRGQATVGVTAFGDTVSLLEPPNAREFAASLCKEAKTDCVAFWDPEYDDHAGTCGGPSFPLIKAVVGMPIT